MFCKPMKRESLLKAAPTKRTGIWVADKSAFHFCTSVYKVYKFSGIQKYLSVREKLLQCRRQKKLLDARQLFVRSQRNFLWVFQKNTWTGVSFRIAEGTAVCQISWTMWRRGDRIALDALSRRFRRIPGMPFLRSVANVGSGNIRSHETSNVPDTYQR